MGGLRMAGSGSAGFDSHWRRTGQTGCVWGGGRVAVSLSRGGGGVVTGTGGAFGGVYSGAEAQATGGDESVWGDHRKPDAADGVLR